MLCKFTDVHILHTQAVVCVRSVHLLTQHSISHPKGLFFIVTAIGTSKFHKKIPDNNEIYINVTQVTDKQKHEDINWYNHHDYYCPQCLMKRMKNTLTKTSLESNWG